MEILSLFKAFLIALPEIVRLLRNIQAMQEDEAIAKKVKEDLGALNDAFEAKDAAAINRIFNS